MVAKVQTASGKQITELKRNKGDEHLDVEDVKEVTGLGVEPAVHMQWKSSRMVVEIDMERKSETDFQSPVHRAQ